ncbi:MAG: hypothetical protein PHE70_00895 [Tepidanaerobacteraceae bacterium]|nr:hypothetical protein [Tepidanaerobacteraceae bacterium]
MNRKFPLKTSFFCGLLLVMILVLTLVNNVNPIGFSKNALFRIQKPETLLEVPGRLVCAGGDTYYNYYQGKLKKLQQNGEAIWDTILDGVLWMGPEGVINACGDSLCMIDGNGKLIFEKRDFLKEPRVLCVQKDYLLLSGKVEKMECAVLLNESGAIIWQVPMEGSIISGSVHAKGTYVVINLIDKKATSKMVVVGPTGAILWNRTPSNIVYKVKVVPEGIGAIGAESAFIVDFEGRPLWEYLFDGQVLRGDIGDDGFITVVVREMAGHLSQDSRSKIIMLSPQGKEVCTYSLDHDPNIVYKAKDYVYIIDDYKVMVLSQEGLLVANIELKGIKELIPTERKGIIAIQEGKSSLLKKPR